jgi:phage-related protein
MKSLLWTGSSKADLLMFPGDARRDAGFQLRKVQRGAL